MKFGNAIDIRSSLYQYFSNYVLFYSMKKLNFMNRFLYIYQNIMLFYRSQQLDAAHSIRYHLLSSHPLHFLLAIRQFPHHLFMKKQHMHLYSEEPELLRKCYVFELFLPKSTANFNGYSPSLLTELIIAPCLITDSTSCSVPIIANSNSIFKLEFYPYIIASRIC